MDATIQIEQSVHVSERYAEHVNREWVRLLDLLQMNVRYERCVGTELFTADGRCILDFLSGYCVHNVGHNHPERKSRPAVNHSTTKKAMPTARRRLPISRSSLR